MLQNLEAVKAIRRVWRVLLRALMVLGLAACAPTGPAALSTPAPSETTQPTLTFYDWPDDMVEAVFEQFTAETGIRVHYATFDAIEEAIENIRAGEQYDVVVMENQFVPGMVAQGLLAGIDYRNVPNFKHVMPSFRDMAYDPGNKHSVPYSWGTTAIIQRTDLLSQTLDSWSDLWDPRLAGRVGGWDSTPRHTLGIALKSLGYSANSESPSEVAAATDRLISAKPTTKWLNNVPSCAPVLISGDVAASVGWSYDVLTAREGSDHIAYVMPREGALLWGDSFVIPANSTNKAAAEALLNFLLRPEIAARVVNENYYAVANEDARAYIEPDTLSDPAIYPAEADLRIAEILLPLSDKGEALHAEHWQRFLDAN